MKIIKYIFFLIGLAILAVAIYSFINTQSFIRTAITTQGTVIEMIRSRSSSSSSGSSSYTYKPVVEFKDLDGERVRFTSSTGANPPSYSKGEIVEVFFDKTAPEKARINGFFSLWGVTLIAGIMGTLFTLLGFFMLFSKYRNDKKIAFLKQRGTPVQANFQSIERALQSSRNRISPYYILVQWKNPMTSELHIFRSENIWFDPTDHIKSDEITVYIERNNPKKYHVDLSFLPKLAN